MTQPPFAPDSGAYLHKMVGMAKHPYVMVDQHDGVAVGKKVVHHAQKTVNVRGVQA